MIHKIKLNKGGGIGDILLDHVVYIFIVGVFFFIMLWYVLAQQSGGAFFEDYYAKEISKVVNLAKPGDEVTLDVHEGTVIARDNLVPTFSEMFVFNNAKNEICVKLTKGRKSCYNYYNNVDIVDVNIILAGGGEENLLVFKVKDKIRGGSVVP